MKKKFQLQESKYLQQLLEFLPVALILVDQNGLILDWNKASLKLFKLENDAKFGKDLASEFTKQKKSKLNDFLSNCLNSDLPQVQIFEFKKNIQYLEATGTRIFTENGQKEALIIFQDISARVKAEREHEFDHQRVDKMLTQEQFLRIQAEKAEEEFKKAKDQLEIIMQNVADGIIVINTAKKIIYANDAASAIFGYSTSKSLLGSSYYQKILSKFDIYDANGNTFPAERLPDMRALRGETYPQETLLFQDSTRRRWLLLKAKPVFDRFKKVQFAVIIIDDITNQRHEEVQREIFIGIAGHELRNDLAGIKAFAQILQKYFKAPQTPKAAEYLTKIDKRVDKLTKLINDLLDVTKIRAGKLDFIDEVFDLNSLIKEAVEDVKSTNNFNLIQEGEVKKLIIADKNRLAQVLVNLLNNAVKYSEKQKEIILSVSQNKNGFHISVQDYGIGIPEAMQKKIFEPFYQIDNQHKKSGLGLGLYLSKEIIHHYHGKIWVESRVGEGATFHIILPFKRSK